MDDRGEKRVRCAALDCLYGMRYLINGRDAIREGGCQCQGKEAKVLECLCHSET